MPMRFEDMTEPEIADVMTAMARAVRSAGEAKGVRPLFVLLAFNDPAVGQYVSNCDRKTIVTALRETADRLERRQDVTRT